MLIGRCILALCLVLVASAAQSQHSPQTPQIQSEQQSKGAPKPKHDAAGKIDGSGDPFLCAPTLVCNNPEPKAQGKGEYGGEEGTEFWPSLMGYRLKITDSLIAAFTFFLFLATIFLYNATRDLVSGAEETAKKQLRAYLGPGQKSGFRFDPGASRRHGFIVELLNTGQTPAYRIRFNGQMKVLPVIDSTTDLLKEYPVDFNEAQGVAMIASHGSSQGHVNMEEAIEPTELNAIFADQSRRIYVWGRAEYFDVFNHRRTFTMSFSIKTSIKMGGALGSFVPDVVVAEQCALGNSAD